MTERVDQMLAAFPRGNLLDDASWRRRHRLLLALLALHLPALLGLATVTGWPLRTAALELLPVVAGLAVGWAARRRVVRSLAVTLGLTMAATVLVHFTGGLTEAHFHYFVVLGFVALYQDWRPYLVALAYIVLGHGILGVVAPGVMYDHPDAVAQPWLWAGVHGGFVMAACAAQIVFWKQTERQEEAAYSYYTKLYEGERAVVDQLRQARDLKDQLIGVVGHEFRTPLTAIQGFARTLDARFDRMDADAVQTCTQAIEREAKRLTRMVANLLTASEELRPDVGDRCELFAAASAAVEQVVEIAPTAGRSIRVHIPRAHVVGLPEEATTQLLSNLLDNAVKFAVPDSDIRVASGRDGAMVVVEVSNVGPAITDIDRERIFDAFVQADSSDTRRYGGMGLGLHIVRKLATAYGGRVGVYGEGPLVIFRAWLPAAGPMRQPLPAHRLPAALPVVEHHIEPSRVGMRH
jgi:signal transduction histidine kinase